MAGFRANLNLTSASNKRYTDEVSFGGVDYSSPRLSVASNHALDELNYVYQDRTVQKRKGFETYENAKADFWYVKAAITSKILSNSTNTTSALGEPSELGNTIYNVWNFAGKIVINQDGVLFYTSKADIVKGKYTPVGRYRGLYTHDSISSAVYEVHKMPSKRLNAYISGEKMYILTGEYVMVVAAQGSDDYSNFTLMTYSLTEVNDSVYMPYVPTTTIGIIQSEASVGGTRQTYESPNMLTDLRKNIFVGGADNKDKSEMKRTFILDNPATSIKSVRIESTPKYGNDYTRLNMPVPIKDFHETGFRYPYAGTSTLVNGSFTSENQTKNNLGLMIDQASFDGLDFDRLTVITNDGAELKHIEQPYCPGVIAEITSDGTDVNLVPISEDIPSSEYDAYDGMKKKVFGRMYANYADGYYVRIFGYNDRTGKTALAKGDMSSYIHECYQSNTYSGKYEAKDLKTSQGYDDHYVIVIYAMVNGEMRYCCIPMKIYDLKGYSTGEVVRLAYEDDTGDIVDSNDYYGNAMIIQHYSDELMENTTHEYCTTSLALLNLIAYKSGDGDSPIPDDSILLAFACSIGMTARKWNKDGTSLVSAAINQRLNDSVATSEEVTPKYRAVGLARDSHTLAKYYVMTRKDYKSLKNELKYGLLSKLPSNITENLNSTQKLYLLVDWFSSSTDATDESTEYIKVYGYYINNGSYVSEIVLLKDFPSSVVGEGNITVEFQAYGYENNKDDINKCTFGIMYGTQNYKNRLFVSGNSDKPTYDWHTGDADDGDGLGYYPDTSVCRYGTITPVVGYGIVSDGKLLVLKETSDRESSVYYRTATYSTRKDDNGTAVTDSTGNTIYEESYPLTQTNSHIGGVSQQLMADFNGDLLFVDSEGRIVGLDNEGTTYDNQRVATTRSALIDPKITSTFRSLYSKNKDEFTLMSYKNDLFYFTPSGTYYTCYDNSYEWYPIDVKGITSWAVVNDVYIFGDIDGNLMFYDKNRAAYKDLTSYPIAEGEIGIDSSGLLIVSDAIKTEINNGYGELSVYFKIDTQRLWCHISDAVEVKSVDGYLALKVKEDLVKSDSIGLARNVSALITKVNITLLDEIELGYDWYLTDYEANNAEEWSNVGIYYPGTADDEYVIDSVDESDNHLTLTINGLYTTNRFNKKSTEIGYTYTYMYVTKETTVSAYYVTAPYLTGSLGNRKVVDTYTIISDVGSQNEIFVKSITNNVTMDEVIAAGGQVDYSKVDFNAIDYTRYDLPHTQTLIGRFYGSFIALSLKSPNAVNSTLTKISYLYHYAGKTYGKS